MNQETLWQAVLAHDSRLDGTFVYAVNSTGVYCRPSCPSRRPRRERVSFFPGAEAAQRAGFRPCRRCRPHKDEDADPQLHKVRRACEYLARNGETRPTLSAVAAHVGVSRFHLQRTFKRLVGISPREYAEACRLGRFKARVRARDPVAVALYEAGYGSSSRLYEKAPAALGMTPATYRRGGKGARIAYTLVDCPLGRLLVAATERGVCAVKLGDADEALERDLAREYPHAIVVRDDTALVERVRPVVEHLHGRRQHLHLPVDVRATAFQWQVWRQLRAIPPGSTLSYAEVARAIGRPTAARAVARACASNPVALVIPCHRVVQADGRPGGYRWGVERKQALLSRERNGD